MELETTFPFPLTVDGIVSNFRKEIKEELPSWKMMLAQSPSEFGRIEEEILAFGRKQSGYLTAALFESSDVKTAILQDSEVIQGARSGLRAPQRRKQKVKLLCGLILSVFTMYCAPRQRKNKKGFKRGVGKRGPEGTGLYPELSSLGVIKGASPALASETSRLFALLPSQRLAQHELKRRGAELNEKTVRSICYAVAFTALSARKRDLEDWRSGRLQAGVELKDKRIAVAFDGGRTRLRTSKKGRSSKTGRRPFDAEWKEPRLLIIYVLDKTGRIDRATPSYIDGTFQGPDHLMELGAYHLHRLGAIHARKVVFLGDGAEWIWNRVPTVIRKVGLSDRQVVKVLDLYHATEQISHAINTVSSMSDKERKKQKARLKGLLLDERLKDIVSYLRYLSPRGEEDKIEGCIDYLEMRKDMMPYRRHRRTKLPIGSGAIESAIRRVINQRLKGNSMYWRKENAEGILYLRAQILSGRWEEAMERVRLHNRVSRKRDWEFDPTPMSVEKDQRLQAKSQKQDRKAAA